MKKGIFTFLFIFIGIAWGKTQIAYYDAIELRKWVDSNSSSFKSDVNSLKEICGILKKYFVQLHDTTDIQTVKDAITTNDPANVNYNPFLAEFFNLIVPEGASNIGKIKSRAGISKMGGLDVTNIANGIAQFMIERAKQELTVAFFERFKKFANDNQEFQVLFPKTTDNLSNLLSHSYPEMLPALRTGFFEDIKSTPYHLDDVLELPRYHALLKSAPEVRVAIRSVRLIHELESGDSHAADILTRFADFNEWQDPNGSHSFTNFGNSVKLASLFSQSLRRIDQQPEKKSDTLITTDTLVIRDTTISKTITFILDTNDVETTITVSGKIYFNTLLEKEEVKRDTLIHIKSSSATRKNTNASVATAHRAWIDFNEMILLVKDDITFRLYMGLLYQEIKKENITFYSDAGDVIEFTDVLQNQTDNLFLSQNKVREFIELANTVDKTLDSIRTSDTTFVAYRAEAFADYMDVSLDVIDYALSIGKLFDERLDLDQYTLIARRANELYRNIYKQEYTQSINSVIDILDEVRNMTADSRQLVINESKTILEIPELKIKLDENKNGEDLSRRNIKKIDAYINSSSGNTAYHEQLKKLKSLYSFNQLSGKLAKISRYGLFIANMAEADSPQEVASILDNAALPVGSSSIKKKSSFNLAVQSYLGAFARLGAIDHKNTTAWTSDFGVSAPIGLAFSKGICSKAGSLSAFITLLDLGAVVDYQLKSDTIPADGGTETAQMVKDYKIELGQIFSPGGYIVYGLPWNIPLALGVGGQYGPGLGKIGDNGETVINNPQWRWNLFLSVDIPFFNIINIHKDQRSNPVSMKAKTKKSK